MERTLVLLKPDALIRALVGEVTMRFERKGLKLVGMKLLQLDESLLADHYSHLADKPFFPRIAEFMSSLPVVAQCWEGKEAVRVVRELAGVTNGREAVPGSIRGDFSMSVQCNLVHASDSVATAEMEIDRFFSSSEIIGYSTGLEDYYYAKDER